MEITIHRGTDEIGGTVTEIAYKNTKILIDFGSQLEGAKKITEVNIDWGTKEKPNYQAVLLTHYHGDHMGEIHQIPDFVPVYLGKTATEMSLVLTEILIKGNQGGEEVSKKSTVLQNIQKHQRYYDEGTSLKIGDIKITPYPADHSAYDAYMFLIECGGKRMVHTGDFRLNGYTGGETLENFKKIGEIDYLITEGTTLSRDGYIPQKEESISQQARSYLAKHKYVFVLCSSMNIDYIASIMNALPENKPLLVNYYQNRLLSVVRKENKLPIYAFPKKNIKQIYKDNTKTEDKYHETGFCMLVTKSKNSSYFPAKLKKYASNEESLLLYGMWDGYLKGEKHKDDEVVAIQDLYDGKFQQLHTSGHVGSEDLQNVIKLLQPKKVIPIHTENQKGVEKLSGDSEVIVLKNGETCYL